MEASQIRSVKPFCYAIEKSARKDYVCDCCNQVIAKRSKYFLKHGITEEHKFYDYRYCVPCYDTKNI